MPSFSGRFWICKKKAQLPGGAVLSSFPEEELPIINLNMTTNSGFYSRLVRILLLLLTLRIGLHADSTS
ncbi:MAG TPA: hypothetical protein PLN52_14000, partial [Opitutaceae bacterium]|nr:hypothetical protein [Opitutaceae bacterium]